MKGFAPLKVTEATVTAALVICFGFAYFAEMMGMAGIIGAFAAGIAVGQTPFRHTVDTKVAPVAYSLFVPVFFVSIGLSVTFDGAGSQIPFMIVLVIVSVLAKLLGGGLGARLTGFSTRSAVIIGTGMISRGGRAHYCVHRTCERPAAAGIFYSSHYCSHCYHTGHAAAPEGCLP